ncbi:MAG: bifunctional [glutamate--ammonia ligase]-adenylyl-L-tyrosine phosphorylase/[glutamate--ammonia-ligase] adenylyltransferase [Gammaproteobacteria bacterium]|nr:bifunctional [glutamate--ammonia ligase]-adenylyl-L-tyrosine phosphorylase/[glutamate--ammonia-ligase] adenylyltransferase [Gammaproteobacteria bacterium]
MSRDPGSGPRLTPELASLAEERGLAHAQACATAGLTPLAPDDRAGERWRTLWALSDFAARTCLRQPGLPGDLAASGDLDAPYPEGSYRRRVAAALAPVGDESALLAALRRLRAREMVRIAWRDLNGLADLNETVHELSDLADAVIDGALGWLHEAQSGDLGRPRTQAGEPQQLVVLAMGKLGGRELNFSSDVDLVFAVNEDGRTAGGRRDLSSVEYFVRLGQRLIAALGERTPEGFVFRVDMRLRPFGNSGPLVMTFDGLETYYQTHGREWERYALVKARPVAGDVAAGERLLEGLRPFVYRKYLDFGAIESLREMKALVAQEVSRKGMQADLKLGPGGIREVEFIAQVFQLIRGGREPSLRGRSLLPTLAALAGRGDLPEQTVRELADAYVFLRRAEHRVQAIDDRQTQALPSDALGQARLACGMGFGDWKAFALALQVHREGVEGHFQRVFSAAGGASGGDAHETWAVLWAGRLSGDAAERALTDSGFSPAGETLDRLDRLRASRTVRLMSPQGRDRLDRLMPLLLARAASTAAAPETLRRLLPLLEATARRSVYLALLIEHPDALARLVQLCSASPWIADHLARYPILLDELLDPRTLFAPPGREGLAGDLAQQMARVEGGDVEEEMDALRLFKQARVLRVAAADVSRALRLMVVSDHLSWLAEVILERVLELARRDLVARHGRPRCRVDGRWQYPSFGIIAYGKLGGLELGYGSDLDLVFLHTSAGEEQTTEGERPVPNAVFFSRLGARIVHLLTARTAAGVLYEVDMRLRPSGSSGLLVSSMDAFEAYQRDEAWIWEHQALVRARPVVGEPALVARFEAARLSALTRERDAETLRREVREMREKMREHLAAGGAGRFDLKQDRGGIADIEFLVQYLALRWGRAHPVVLRYTDNVRLLEGLTVGGCLPATEATLLTQAYLAFRARAHALALQGLEGVVHEDAELTRFRDGVAALWHRLMES